ncbi:DUF4399 domain-containing protein [Gallaecimonas xiamenensis]|uniref:DUF4399 domain-containing protein n=1 Tax=Gallaecimonas xiamenensis 3-C-1 TaxID=745411 RepID=K2JRG7_9GAMM|nr:DUF4399 domain-containing protein [Gallaecimonas xiamenensis]EKE67750.1 hypothetical protein B3C1_18076 [Gallaecimonas xiamenensis 3-C-1]
MKNLFAAAALLACSSSAFATQAPEGASVYFIAPADGATVSQTFTVKFGLHGMGVAPAGTNVANTGHHHLLIDVDQLPDMSMPLPATEHIKHFGGGQTETQLTLAPGKHTLQLVLGDFAHIPFNPAVMSDKITVTVK